MSDLAYPSMFTIPTGDSYFDDVVEAILPGSEVLIFSDFENGIEYKIPCPDNATTVVIGRREGQIKLQITGSDGYVCCGKILLNTDGTVNEVPW